MRALLPVRWVFLLIAAGGLLACVRGFSLTKAGLVAVFGALWVVMSRLKAVSMDGAIRPRGPVPPAAAD